MRIGYARVSTTAQNLDIEVLAPNSRILCAFLQKILNLSIAL